MIYRFMGHLTDICKRLFHYAIQFFLIEYIFKGFLLYCIVNGKRNWQLNDVHIKFGPSLPDRNTLADRSTKILLKSLFFSFLITHEDQNMKICLIFNFPFLSQDFIIKYKIKLNWLLSVFGRGLTLMEIIILSLLECLDKLWIEHNLSKCYFF